MLSFVCSQLCSLSSSETVVNDSQTKYWLGFSLIPTIGTKRLLTLLNSFGDLAAAWTASEGDLRSVGVEGEPLKNLLQFRRSLDPDAEMAKVERVGAHIVTLVDEAYPALLRDLPDAPALLYVRGSLLPSDSLAIGVVGTRKATVYGLDAARDLSKQLAQNSITVISGLAQGIDTAAHRGALAGGGRTLAVTGCGIDTIYPPQNRDLAADIMSNGAIVTEFSVGAPPDKRNFPRRNRVISGMSLGVLVIEAPVSSGALITAESAAEQGRDVFAVPGNIFNANSHGTNRLIQDGAKLVQSVEDILNELHIAHHDARTRTQTVQIVPESETEAQIIAHLSADPIHVDDLARACGMPIAAVTSVLTILELKGLARKIGSMQYSLMH
jgi:DNA processing protein